MNEEKHWSDEELLSREGEIILPIKDGNGGLRNEWVYDKKEILYKPGEEFSYKGCVEGELIYYYLAKALGMDALEIKPALYVAYENIQNKNKHFIPGSVSKTFLNEGEKLIEFYQLPHSLPNESSTIKGAMSILERYIGHLQESKQKQVIVDYDEIEKKLTEVTLLDWFAKNRDRHSANLGIIVNQNDKNVIKIRLAPIYDNAMIFDYIFTEKFGLMVKTLKQNESESFEDMAKANSEVLFMPNYEIKSKHNFELYEKAFKEFIVSSHYARRFFEKIRKINFDEVYSQLKKCNPDFKLSKNKFLIAKNIFNFKIKSMERYLKNEKELSF